MRLQNDATFRLMLAVPGSSVFVWSQQRDVADSANTRVCPVSVGIDDPYEEPLNAELVLEAVDSEGNKVTPQVSAGKILEYLHAKQFI
jgi:adenylylsulfate kinase-like enzyme